MTQRNQLSGQKVRSRVDVWIIGFIYSPAYRF
jgi:hypothetical protein